MRIDSLADVALAPALAPSSRTTENDGSGAYADAARTAGTTASGGDSVEERSAHEARMQVVRDYIETCGAPEEKDQDQVAETFWKRIQEEDDDRRGEGLPGNALTTRAVVVRDPENEGETHVYTVKTDAEGKGRITRHVSMDSGDGEDRSGLTPDRARARKAYERRLADAKEADKDDASRRA